MQGCKRFARGLSLLLAAICSSPALYAAEPPAGTITDLNNVGLFDGSVDRLTSCVALQNADGTPQLDATGKARIYNVVLSLHRPTLTFTLLSNTAFNTNAGLDCSGTFRNGAYSDAILITNLSPYYNGMVWNLTLDYVLNSNLEFKLRLDSSFGAVRTFAGNTTQFGSDLGDFAQSAVREYGLTNIAPTIVIKLPQCNDPQGDQNYVMVVRNGTVLGGASPGTNFGWSTTGLTAGDYQFQTYCSDQMAIQALATANGLTFSPTYAAISASAPGTLTLRIVEGNTPTPTTAAGTLTFNFSSTTSASDQQLIRDTVEFARDFLATTFGRTLQKNTTIATLGPTGGCANPGASAFTGAQTMTLCIGNQGWTVHGPVNKKKILIHEVFHLLQFELQWLGRPAGAITGPHWLIEGSAEYVGWLGIASLGDATLDTARGCMLKEVADYALQQPPGLPNLSALESGQGFGPGPVYPLSMIGADQLIAGSSTAALLTYGSALASGTAWATAFNNAFGTTSTAFYAQFPAYKAGLSVPASYLCRI